MFTSGLSAFRAVVRATLLAGLFIGATGCGTEIITHAKDSKDQGIQLYQEQQYAEAAGAFRNAIKQDPRDHQSFWYLGNSYAQLGQYQQAIQAYKSALDVTRTSLAGMEDREGQLQIMDSLANAIIRSNAVDSELTLIEQRAQSTKKSDDYLLLAKVYRYRGDADSAIQYYKTAIDLNREDYNLRKEYGLYLEQLGQMQQAEAQLRKAYSLNQNDQEVGVALRRLGIIPGPTIIEKTTPKPLPKTVPPMDWSQRDGSRPAAAPAPVQPPAPQSEPSNAPRD